ncbi:MAG: Spy/CpxP family protein refolding chaperone [bacterium]
MNTKTQTTFIIFSTLIIGIVIGALGSGVFRGEKERQFDTMRRQQRFQKAFEKVVQPTEKQRKALHKALRKHFEQMSEIHEKHQDAIFAIYDSLQQDLASVLTEEQHAKLKTELAHGHRRLYRRRIEDVALRLRQLTNDLDLDQTQKQKIDEILKNFDEELLTAQQSRENWFELRETRQKAMRQVHEDIEAVLTPEQRMKFREMRLRQRPRFGPPGPGPFPDRPFRERGDEGK